MANQQTTMYFSELIFENVLSFCGPSIKEVQPILTTGVYVVGKPKSMKKFNILEITPKWIVVSSKWKDEVRIKKMRNTSLTELKTIGITPFNKLECLFTEEEWKTVKPIGFVPYKISWRAVQNRLLLCSKSINYRIFNLQHERKRLDPPIPFFEAIRDSVELEHLILDREIKEIEAEFTLTRTYGQMCEHGHNMFEIEFSGRENSDEDNFQRDELKRVWIQSQQDSKEATLALRRATSMRAVLQNEN